MKTLALVAVLALAGCGGDAGSSCSADSDCSSGLKCMDESFGVLVSGGGDHIRCLSLGKHCTAVCTSDVDCASIGDGLHCIANCPDTLAPTCRPSEMTAE